MNNDVIFYLFSLGFNGNGVPLEVSNLPTYANSNLAGILGLWNPVDYD